MKIKIFTATIALVILTLSGLFFIVSKIIFQPEPANISIATEDNESQSYVYPITVPNYIPILNSSISRPQINARAYLVYDTHSSRILIEKNIKERLPIASLTKILSAVVALEKFSPEDIVSITEASIKVDGEKQELYLGEKISLRNLFKLMLIESSNDAAYAVANFAKEKGINFVKEMNTKAGALGMNNSLFTDPAGLDDSAYSSAEDLIRLVEYSLNYQEIWNISAEKTAIVESTDLKIKHSITTTNRLLGFLSDIIGGKTGRTDGALECLILITAVPNYPSKIISIVLGSNDRFGDTQKLIDWTRTAYRWK